MRNLVLQKPVKPVPQLFNDQSGAFGTLELQILVDGDHVVVTLVKPMKFITEKYHREGVY
jgi:hypothetical protein